MGKRKGKRNKNRWQLGLADICAVVFSLAFAYLTTQGVRPISPQIIVWTVGNLVLAIAVFFAVGLYRILFRTVGFIETIKIICSAFVIGLANVAFSVYTKQASVGLGTAFVYTMSLSASAFFVRYWYRLFLVFKRYIGQDNAKKTRVMVVGGGDSGFSLIREMQNSDKLFYLPVCIADDDSRKIGKLINGVKVVCATKDIPEYVKKCEVQEIFVAMPSVNKKRLSEIVSICKDCGKPVKILPGIYQLASGQVAVSSLRNVEVHDLLGREQVSVNLDEIMGYIENQVVLVTGGGGSIGSELCRQIATHNPKQLIIFDIYENNAYEIEQELKRNHPDLNLLTLIGSVRDERKVRDVFFRYEPNIVFHAAAHKHVPLMETSPHEAVKNNVIGTLNVAKIADETKVKTFVQISTDKAVNPTNVMGATKRICEMIVQTIGKKSKHTKFVAVRFGNVLGSNGSVIPLFKKQIEAGGPVTVTHKDIIRYFMTIPEAVSLVLQAGAYAKEGQIFVLDMGEPVKIYDLAYNLIKLSGLEPNVDVDIVCTGLRPGEKLFEERLMEEEGLQQTANGLISVAKPIQLNEAEFWTTLETLCAEAYNETGDVKELVQALVPTYTIDRLEERALPLKARSQRKLEKDAVARFSETDESVQKYS